MRCEGVEEKTSSSQLTRKSGNEDEIIKKEDKAQVGSVLQLEVIAKDLGHNESPQV
jgi:hypothetical protein